MKVLVTGANGFLANNVVRELERRNIRVRAMVRHSADLRPLKDSSAEVFKGDFSQHHIAEEAVRGCNCVIHVAADTAQNYSTENYNFLCNVTGTKNLLDAAVRNRTERFIFVSSANTFCHGTMESPGDESRPARYPFTLSGYAASKSKAQEIALGYAQNGLSVIIVNPTFMIGQYDFKPSSGRIITMMYGKRVIPVPPGGKNFIHVSDAATAICNALTMGKTGNCYLLANENLTYSDFYKKMKEACGLRIHQVKLRRGLMVTLGYLAQTASVAGYKSDLNPVNARILCEGNYFSGRKAVLALGLPQTPVVTAISDAVEWFGKNGYLKEV